MTGAFIFGVLFVVVALQPKFWELVGWPPEKDESGEARVGRRIIRLILMLAGSALVAFNFPGIPENLPYPGWFFFGAALLYFGYDRRWSDLPPFKRLLEEDYKDTGVVLAWMRILAIIIGSVGIGFGLGAGCPTPPPAEPAAVVEEAPAAAESVSETELTDKTG